MQSRALGIEGTASDLLSTNYSGAVASLAMAVSTTADSISRRAVALHDLTNCLIDADGQLRLGTELLDAEGEFKDPVWCGAATVVHETLRQSLKDGGKSIPLEDLPKEALIRLTAIHLILNDTPRFALAVIRQDGIDKQARLAEQSSGQPQPTADHSGVESPRRRATDQFPEIEEGRLQAVQGIAAARTEPAAEYRSHVQTFVEGGRPGRGSLFTQITSPGGGRH